MSALTALQSALPDPTLADRLVAENFGVASLPRGTSFLAMLGNSSLDRPHA